MLIPSLDALPGFPDPARADADGLVAMGGDLAPERLLAAYRAGIFPWPHRGWPLLWFSPDPRWLLEPARLHVPRRLGRRLRQGRLRFSLDTAFPAVIRACARIPRGGERGTWITGPMRDAYTALHEQGWAHSVEAWQGERLVGGLYGVAATGTFSGESMFATVPDASKAALAVLVRQLGRWGFAALDAQMHSPHTEAMGSAAWPRERFLAMLRAMPRPPGAPGPWRLDEDLAAGQVG